MLQRLGQAIATLMMVVIAGCNSNTSTGIDAAGTSGVKDVADSSAGYYSIAEYDPEADAAADLATTVSRAEAESKRIILISGGDW